MNYRPLRVAKLIKEELGMIIEKELEFPGALFTITEIEVNKKLETARVEFSVFPSSSAEEVLKILEKSAGRLQYLLMKKINIKPMPRIFFEIDRGPENAARVEKIFLESKKK